MGEGDQGNVREAAQPALLLLLHRKTDGKTIRGTGCRPRVDTVNVSGRLPLRWLPRSSMPVIGPVFRSRRARDAEHSFKAQVLREVWSHGGLNLRCDWLPTAN